MARGRAGPRCRRCSGGAGVQEAEAKEGHVGDTDVELIERLKQGDADVT